MKYNDLINEIIQPLKNNKISLNGEIFRYLFIISFNDLNAADVGNPLVHHLIVLKHMIKIALKEDLQILQAGAIAILHDIAPIEKIRKADLIIENSIEKMEVLEEKRKHHRILHMKEGSILAKKNLNLLNKYLGKRFYNKKDIEIVCNVISIHDNPSIGLPIPKDNHMAVSFREADRLWMLNDEGFAYDLQRDEKNKLENIDKKTLASDRLNHIIQRYKEERELYNSSNEIFQNDDLFFRTKSGYGIYLKYIQERKKQYEIQ